MASISKIAFKLFTFSTVVFVYSCANQMGPSGGEIDKTPPAIEEITPVSGTVNFTGDVIEVTFSEYVDKRSVRDAIFISPSIDGKIEYDWSGRTLQLEFEKPFRKNTTYIITFGTDIIDVNNRNPMAESFNLTFSTGSKIDNGKISGKVYDEKPAGTMVFAYVITDTLANPMTQKPNYLSQVGINGNYELLGLSKGKYLVFAVKDDFKDLIYNIGDDYYGAPSQFVNFTEIDSVFAGLDFFLTKEDTGKPHLSSVTLTDRNHALIEFLEPVDSTKLNNTNFFFYDSTVNRGVLIDYVYKGTGKSAQWYLSFSDSLSEENDNYLFVKNILDKNGNMLRMESVSVIPSSKADTTVPAFSKHKTSLPNNQVDPLNPKLELLFSEGINSTQFLKAVKVIDKNENTIRFTFKKNDDANFELIIQEKLKSKSDYKILLDLSLMPDAAGNKLDSVHTVKFQTISDLDFSGVAGEVKNLGKDKKVMAVLKSADNKEISYISETKPDHSFIFEKVQPGKYFLWSFCDDDSNAQYSKGAVSPLHFSEMFKFYPDTLNLRARWPVGDVIIKY